MSFLTAVGQVIVFLILLKLSHILYWNVRKSYHVHPWLLEAGIAVVLVTLLHFVTSVWGLVIVISLAMGLIRGDQESKTATSRQLL